MYNNKVYRNIRKILDVKDESRLHMRTTSRRTFTLSQVQFIHTSEACTSGAYTLYTSSMLNSVAIMRNENHTKKNKDLVDQHQICVQRSNSKP